jgi:hypothetical protein
VPNDKLSGRVGDVAESGIQVLFRTSNLVDRRTDVDARVTALECEQLLRVWWVLRENA